jgi:hypothetical protein
LKQPKFLFIGGWSNRIIDCTRAWRNWQTHSLEVAAGATPCWFKSSRCCHPRRYPRVPGDPSRLVVHWGLRYFCVRPHRHRFASEIHEFRPLRVVLVQRRIELPRSLRQHTFGRSQPRTNAPSGSWRSCRVQRFDQQSCWPLYCRTARNLVRLRDSKNS